jgi:two-component system, response regulator PdtaR
MLFGKRERLIQRILVVEDEPLVAFDNEHLLGEAGYEVVATVDSLEDARSVIESGDKIDLVLTDISLSGEGDGTDVARIAGERGIPVLFVSGACPEGAQSLAVGCLSKPYTDKIMKAALDCLDEVLQGREVKKLPPQLSLYERAAG